MGRLHEERFSGSGERERGIGEWKRGWGGGMGVEIVQ